MSEDAYRQVRARLDLSVSDLGERTLKSIAEPMRVYALEVGTPARREPAAPAMLATAPLALPSKPSIAVLPFQTMSGDAEQEFFTDGLTEDIITDLSNVPGFFVIARNSTFAYKGKSTDVRQVAKELGVSPGTLKRRMQHEQGTAQCPAGARRRHDRQGALRQEPLL